MKSKSTDRRDESLYFVALVPPEPLFTAVKKLKEEVRDRFGSKAALRSPPHITLHMPFPFREDRQEHIVHLLEWFALNQQSFLVRHHGMGAFEPRVIFVNVDLSGELAVLRHGLVNTMRRALKLENADYKNQGFHPHMTIAFRDLRKPLFREAWRQYQHLPFEAEWHCHSLCLMKHDGEQWQQYRTFTFGK